MGIGKIEMNKSLRICVGVAALFLATSASQASAAETPNFVIIFADDLGYGDVGCYGAQGYKTPEIDRMAQEGMRFSDFSVSDSICTPSRAGLLTGRYAQRWGYKNSVYFPWSNEGMPQSEVTIAEVLKAADYQTAMIGKWHLGHKSTYLPTHQGFDTYFGIPYSNDMTQDGNTALAQDVQFNEGMTRADYRACRGSKDEIKKVYDTFKNKVPLMRGTEVIEWPVDQSQLTKRYTEAAVDFIRTNQERPFFLYLAHAMPHVPLYASGAFKGKTERGIFGDVIEELDWSVGQVLQTLRETGLDKNTLVIFTSDNGPWAGLGESSGSAGPLRGAKFTSYEGGQRVPCIAWRPGFVPAGKVCEEQISTLDLLPTFARLAGTEPPSDRKLDGLDIREVLKGGNAPTRNFTFYRDGQAIRVGDWKYRKGKKVDGLHGVESPIIEQLFNLDADLSESKNLIQEHPEKAQELMERLRREKEGMLH
jgi:arylsulfatase A